MFPQVSARCPRRQSSVSTTVCVCVFQCQCLVLGSVWKLENVAFAWIKRSGCWGGSCPWWWNRVGAAAGCNTSPLCLTAEATGKPPTTYLCPSAGSGKSDETALADSRHVYGCYEYLFSMNWLTWPSVLRLKVESTDSSVTEQHGGIGLIDTVVWSRRALKADDEPPPHPSTFAPICSRTGGTCRPPSLIIAHRALSRLDRGGNIERKGVKTLLSYGATSRALLLSFLNQ